MKKYWKQITAGLLIASVFFLVNPFKTYAFFSFSRTISIDHTKVASDQTNFPILATTTASYLATVANGGKVQNANGYDIGFYSNSDCETGKLSWETELYTASTGQVIYWIKVPTVSSSVDTVIYMCYGDGSISTDQSNKTGVWDSNFLAVYHLPDGSSLSGTDSTSNAYNLTNHGSWGAAAGQIDGATAKSNATSQYLSNASLASPNTITISFWQKVLTGDTKTDKAFMFTDDTTAGNGQSVSSRILIHGPFTDNEFYWDYGNDTNNDGRVHTPYASYLDAWTYVTVVYDNATGNHVIYFNGSSIISNTHSNANQNFTGIVLNADRPTSPVYGKRQMDEVRVSNSARTANWISAEYKNQSSAATFYTIGGEVNVPTTEQSTHKTVLASNHKYIFNSNHKYVIQ